MAEAFCTVEYQESVVLTPRKRKIQMRFSCHHDILLLREVVAINPYAYENPKDAWKNIAENLRTFYTVDSRRCRERTSLLLQYYEKNNQASLRRSGTEEEFTERNQLLQEIKELKYEAQITSEKSQPQAIAGQQVRDAAMTSLSVSSPEFPSDEDTNVTKKVKKTFFSHTYKASKTKRIS
ncbi:uncharacterized protein LOC111622884 [Centruroides sculpturatus]|uniref:uncharacterized protein LOC111622884 n=1 Tax=Centruroides sculpturatus TaxID=218467 RepID=UPI000C6E950A|nr:uncharacterized protein LOC111622884 [Centruroides sculpturatus]